MNVKELTTKTLDELNETLQEQLALQFKLRMQKSTGQLNETHMIKQVRRDIARIQTVLSQKSSAA